MEISAALVRELREKTGLPMMECKQALTEAQGDMAKAIEVLKRFGSAKISKMATRETSQGRIACHVAGQRASIVEVLCETAPVANTDDFQALAKAIAEAAAALDAPTPDAVLAAPAPGHAGKTINDLKGEVFNRLRENIVIKRVACVSGHVAHYVHHNAQVGVVIALSGDCPAELRADVCMHIAAMNPPYLRRADVDAAAVEEERARAAEEAKGKPAQIIEKIVAGKLDRWYAEVVLLDQPFVKDDKHSVGQVLANAAAGLTVTQFHRFQVGG